MAQKYTIYVPDPIAETISNAYYALLNIDSNFSRLLQCLVSSILRTAKFIRKQKKNFRHYEWHIIIQDKETKRWYSTSSALKNKL